MAGRRIAAALTPSSVVLGVLFVLLAFSIPGVPRFIDEDLNFLEALVMLTPGKQMQAGITTGWPVLLPIGLLSKIFTSLYTSRIVMLGFTMGFFLAWRELGRFWKVPDAFIAALLVVIAATPNFSSLSVQLLGEVPAAMFSILALLSALRGRFFLSGILMALAFSTKTIFLPLLGFFFLGVLLWSFKMKKRQFAVSWVLGCLLILGVTEVGALVKMGVPLYSRIRGVTLSYLWDFVTNSHSGVGTMTQKSAGPGFWAGISSKLANTEFKLTGIYLRAYFVVTFVAGIVAAVYALVKKEFLVAPLLGFASFIVAWWFLLSATMWYRHVFPGVILGIPLVLLFLTKEMRKKPSSWLKFSSILLWAFILIKLPAHLWNFTAYTREPKAALQINTAGFE